MQTRRVISGRISEPSVGETVQVLYKHCICHIVSYRTVLYYMNTNTHLPNPLDEPLTHLHSLSDVHTLAHTRAHARAHIYVASLLPTPSPIHISTYLHANLPSYANTHINAYRTQLTESNSHNSPTPTTTTTATGKARAKH